MGGVTSRRYRMPDSPEVVDAPQGRVGQDQFLCPDGGRQVAVLRVTEPRTTRVVAITPDGQTVLRWRWDHAAGRSVVELPGAVLDPADAGAALPAAGRGLRMTGWAATGWDPLAELATVTGVTARTVHVYLARGLYPVPAGDTADTTVITGPWGWAVELATAGRLETTSAAAVLIADHHRRIHQAWATPEAGDVGDVGVPGARAAGEVPPRFLYLVRPGDPTRPG